MSADLGVVWIQLITSTFCILLLLRFSLFFLARVCWLFHGKQCICILFTDSQIPIFNNFFIKNGSHDTIHTFKNYFARVFLVFSFQFQQNKFYPNGPLKSPCAGTSELSGENFFFFWLNFSLHAFVQCAKCQCSENKSEYYH